MKVTIKVAAIILNENSEVLLIKERYEKDGEPKWNLVKGTYDDAKETVTECINREIKEEVGLTAKGVELKRIYHYGDNENQRILFVFFVRRFEGVVSVPVTSDQEKRKESIVEAHWVNKDDIRNITEKDFIAPYVYQTLKNIEGLDKREVEILRID